MRKLALLLATWLVASSVSGQDATLMPVEWRALIRNGLELDVLGHTIEADGESWDLHLHGRALTSGWSNVELARRRQTAAGETIAVSLISGVQTADKHTEAHLRASVSAEDQKYLGELVPGGAAISDFGPYQLSGTVGDYPGNLYVVPYVQFTYRARDNVDFVLRLQRVTIAPSGTTPH